MNPIFSIQPISSNFGLALFFSYEANIDLEGYDNSVDITKLNLLIGFTNIGIGIIKY